MKKNQYDRTKDHLKKIVPLLLNFLLWTAVILIVLFVSNFVISKLNIQNNFIIIIFTSFIISIFLELIYSHDEDYYFKKKWAFFYFLVYSTTLWVTNEFLIIGFLSQNIFKELLLASAILSVAIILLKNFKIKSKSLPWLYLILILILGIGNLSNFSNLIPSEFNPLLNDSEFSEEEIFCPSATHNPNNPLILEEKLFSSANSMNSWAGILINYSVWRIENGFNSCYKGKYSGQFPDRIYCDDLIVSRWEKRSSGAINYRWYTAVTAEWAPTKDINQNSYIFNGFICENGQKVTVEKGITNYYVYDSRSSGQIRIKY